MREIYMNSCIVTTFYFFSIKVFFKSQLCSDNKQLFFLMKLHSLEDKPIATDVGIKVGIKARRW